MRWLGSPRDTPETFPAAWLVALPGATPAARRAGVRRIVARRLGCLATSVVVDHDARGAPLIAAPRTRLHLSSASRGPIAAVALAFLPVGVDVELVDPAPDVPWGVLAPVEAAILRALPESERGPAFARLWTVKEAWTKALGLGLRRDPRTFAVSGFERPGAQPAISDPDVAPPATIALIEREVAGRTIVAACVVR